MKKCKFCAEDIQDEAIKCKHCGSNIGESKNQDNSSLSNSSFGKVHLSQKSGIFNKGCLTVIGVILGLGILGSILSSFSNKKNSRSNATGVDIAEPENLEKSSTGVVMFCAEHGELIGIAQPQKGFLYPLCTMRVMQKVEGGYLLIPSECPVSGIGGTCDPALLYTNMDLQQGYTFYPVIIPQGKYQWAYYVEDTEYTTITGFNKRIHVYKLYEGEVDDREYVTTNENPNIESGENQDSKLYENNHERWSRLLEEVKKH